MTYYELSNDIRINIEIIYVKNGTFQRRPILQPFQWGLSACSQSVGMGRIGCIGLSEFIDCNTIIRIGFYVKLYKYYAFGLGLYINGIYTFQPHTPP